MSDNFQVFAIELETLIPFDSIEVAPERLAQLQKSSAQDLALETLKNTFLTRWLEKREQCPLQIPTTGIIEKRFRSTTEFCLRVRKP